MTHDNEANYHIAAELEGCSDKLKLAEALIASGLNVQIGTYALRIQNCSHFVLRDFGLLNGPVIDADADSFEQLLQDGQLVSRALALAGIRHCFELYDANNKQVGYLHYAWPLQRDA